MKIKSILLPIFAGGSLVLPSWGDSAAQLIQAEAKDAPAAGAELTAVPDGFLEVPVFKRRPVGVDFGAE